MKKLVRPAHEPSIRGLWLVCCYLTQVATYTGYVILSEARAKNLHTPGLFLADTLEILRRYAPQNDMATNG